MVFWCADIDKRMVWGMYHKTLTLMQLQQQELSTHVSHSVIAQAAVLCTHEMGEWNNDSASVE